jgi:hypothetical protein
VIFMRTWYQVPATYENCRHRCHAIVLIAGDLFVSPDMGSVTYDPCTPTSGSLPAARALMHMQEMLGHPLRQLWGCASAAHVTFCSGCLLHLNPPPMRPRSASSLSVVDQQELFGSLWRAPLVWLMLNVLRFVLIVAFRCVLEQP